MRNTAYKVSIASLLAGEYKPSAGEYDPSFVRVGLKEVGRCNVIGTLTVIKPEAELDDGTGAIRVLLPDGPKPKEGEIVRVIGKPRERDGQRFIFAEIIKPVTEDWLELRKLELGFKKGE